MGRVKTFTNGGSLLPGDLNSIQDDYENGFATYKHLGHFACNVTSSSAGATRYLTASSDSQGQATTSLIVSPPALVVPFDPANLPGNGRTAKLRLYGRANVNDVAPAKTFTLTLKPVTSPTGSGALAMAVGAAVAGSTVTLTTPTANSTPVLDSTDFTAPAAGQFIVEVAQSGTAAVNSVTVILLELFGRTV